MAINYQRAERVQPDQTTLLGTGFVAEGKLPTPATASNRQFVWLTNSQLEVAVAVGGGHLSAIRIPELAPHVNPLWVPPWISREPRDVSDTTVNEDYGGAPEGRLLASILGHSIALDLYGAPSPEEAAAGAITHGKVGVLPWEWTQQNDDHLIGSCRETSGQIVFTRELKLAGPCVVVEESVQNLCEFDRHFAWQQHVSLGAPFCEDGFWANSNCHKGKTHPQSFGDGASLIANTETAWPYAPRRDGSFCDYRCPLKPDAVANDFTGFEIQRRDPVGNFVAGNSRFGFAVFYVWPRKFFPWLGVWDEKHARALKPWEKKASVRAYEFGVSPYPLLRREQLLEPSVFDLPTFLMLPAKISLKVRYIFGVFPGVAEPGEIQVVGQDVVLANPERLLAKVTLPCECDSSDRWEMRT